MINGEEDDVIPMSIIHSFSPSIVNCMRNITTELKLERTNLNEQAWNCLGCILSNNTSVTTLNISLSDLDVSWLCAGLQYNQNIKDFRLCFVDLGAAEKMKSLAPFLSDNSSLTDITLSHCSIGTVSIDALVNALANRTADICDLNLRGNNLGDCNLDQLVTVLSTCTRLQSLWLSENGIGQRVCTCLAQLLKSPESNLEYLYLNNSLIDDEAVDILVDSLAKNAKLDTLTLDGNSRITRSGWQSLLKLVCDASSMTAVKESNHTLNCLGSEGDMKAIVISALGVDDTNLLYESLKLNNNWSSSSIIRQKMIWAHARGDIKFAGSDIPVGAMPVILSWFGDYSNEENDRLIQYHNPPLSEEVVKTKRLDSLYRIIREMPDLCQSGQPESDAGVKKSKLCHDVEQISLVESEDTSELADSLARSQRGEFLIDTILRICNVIALVLLSYSYIYGAQSGD